MIFAIQTLPPDEKSEIYRFAVDLGLEVLEVPTVNKWFNGRFQLNQLNKIEVKDLLSREPIQLNMKMIENDKLIARPVVFHVEQIPILALPFYIFPLKKGRHSGFLPFSFGKFEKGERFVRNVGYYWAASEYFDLMSAMDYFEEKKHWRKDEME